MKNLLYTLLAVLALVSCAKEEEVVTPPAPKQYTLAISAETGGTVSTEGGLYNEGSKITVTATPDGMYLFKEWSDGSTQNPREITVTSNLTLKASFIKKKYRLSVTVEGEGRVQEEVIIQGSTSETTYNAGTTVRLTATPNEGWVFAGWSGDVESEELVIEVPIEKGTSVNALFKRDFFELNITIEGEGTVKEEVIVQPGQYDYESVVRLTAIPADGWKFANWSGDFESEEVVIDVSMDKSVTINVYFNMDRFSVYTSEITVPNSTQYGNLNLYQSIVNITAKIYYSNAYGEYFIFGPSTNSEYANSDSREDVPPAYPIVLRRDNDEWLLDQIYTDVPFWLARNFKLVDGTLVIGDGNELGKYGAAWESEHLEDRFKWRGNAYLADLSNEDIIWTKVNNEDNMAYFHGITFGDINGDGLIDVGGAPAPSIKLFINNGGDDFTNNDDLINYPENLNFPFTIEFEDLDNDGIDEIITASYGNANNPLVDHNAIQVFKLDDLSGKFESVFYDNFLDGSNGNVLGATSIKVFDFNNDGIKDISVCREDANNDSFEIWLGKSYNEFEPYFFQNLNEYDVKVKEFEVMDVNLDGYLDIVLNIFQGSGFNTSDGLNFNKAVWINDGSGKFKTYSQNDLTVDLIINSYTSFMKDGILNIVAPNLSLEEVMNSQGEDLTFKFTHIKFYLN